MITISKGTIHLNTELTGKMDPFIEVEYSGLRKRTTTIEEGGTNPVWDQTLEFEIYSLEDSITIQCFDEDFTRNDNLGSATIPIRDLGLEKLTRKWIELKYKDKIASEVLLLTKLVEKNENSVTKRMSVFGL